MPRTTMLTCPHCHTSSEETMQISKIERHMRCFSCDHIIEAPADAHCVWCAYGDTPCYYIQNTGSCNPITLEI